MATTYQNTTNLLPPSDGFGALLRRWRQTRGITQTRLARLVECDRAALSRWERGTRNPTRESALALVNALSLTGAHRVMFLSQLGYLEHSLTEAQASYLAGWRDGFSGRYERD